MTFEDWMEHVVRGFEISGAAVLVAGSLTALLRYLRGAVRGEGDYQQARTDIGRAILMGLEVLIIADIVQTITVDTTVESAVTLGLVVLVRTFLSFSLEVELDGVVPWRKAKASTPPSAPAPAPGDVT